MTDHLPVLELHPESWRRGVSNPKAEDLTLSQLLLELGDRQAQLTRLTADALEGGPFHGAIPLRADERLGNRVFLVTPAALPRLRPYLRDVG